MNMMTIAIAGFILMLPSLTSHDVCPESCQCSPVRQSMTCNGQDGQLRYIPQLPSFVRTFTLISAQFLANLTRESTTNLTSTFLFHLILINNDIVNVHFDSLRDLQYLTYVEWKQRYLPTKDIFVALSNSKGKIGKLKLESETADSDTVSASSFRTLTNLKSLRLRIENMVSFNTTGLNRCKLVVLRIQNTALREFLLHDINDKLETLHLTQNNIFQIPQLCSSNSIAYSPSLRKLELRDNSIRDIDMSGIECIKRLKYINLSQNRIHNLKNNTFSMMLGLHNLELSSLTSLKHIADCAFNSSSLRSIVFKDNPSLDSRKANVSSIFTYAPSLVQLDISGTVIKNEYGKAQTKFLLSLATVKYLFLQDISLNRLPVGVFSRLPMLEILILAGNSITYWDADVFANVTNIKKISFNGCKIHSINETSFPIEFRQSIRDIDLSKNPFSCDCKLLWFLTWLKQSVKNSSITFTQYPRLYFCYDANNIRVRLDHYDLTPEHCLHSLPYTIIITIIASFLLVVIIVSLTIYRHRWNVLYCIALLRRKRHVRGGDPLIDWKYDAFISYSNADYEWVDEQLLGYLEDEVGLKLCEHKRDFDAGKLIVDNVINAMQTSKKMVLVLSNNYMESEWCELELNMAHHAFMKQELDIVLIMIQPIKACNVSSSLHALVSSTSYLDWSLDPKEQHVFKTTIRRYLTED